MTILILVKVNSEVNVILNISVINENQSWLRKRLLLNQ